MQEIIQNPLWWYHQKKDAMVWIDLWLRRLGTQYKEADCDETVNGHSCLFKLSTAIGVLYFKACRQFPREEHRTIFSSEVYLTQILARAFPQSLPDVMAIEPERQWMLLRESGSLVLRDRPVLAVWKHTLESFAQLQVASLSFTSLLLHEGCADRCLNHLVDDFEEVLNEPEIWSQTCLSVREYFYRSLPLLHCLCEQLADVPVPAATLVHGDLHAGNIALHQDRPVFLDWSDGCLAHPFFDAVIFLARLGRLKQQNNAHHMLQNTYLAAWQPYASPVQLAQAMRLAEVLACVHQVVSCRTLLGQEEPWKQEMHDGLKYWVKTLLERL